MSSTAAPNPALEPTRYGGSARTLVTINAAGRAAGQAIGDGDSVLVHATASELRLGRVDEGAIALGVDERVNGVLRGRTRNELAVPAPPPCVSGHPDVSGQAPQQAEAALAVGRLFWIRRRSQHPRVAHARDVQNAVAIVDGERPRGAATRMPGGDVRGERDRPDTDRVAVLEPVIDARGRVAEDTDPQEGPQ